MAPALDLSGASGGVTIQAANQWTSVASLPFPRAYTVTGVANGKLYTIGGSDLNQIYNSVTEYNPATNTWVAKAPLPKKLNSQLGATALGSVIYVPGGWDGSAYQNALLVFDPIANVWSTGPVMPVAGACGGSLAMAGQLYVAVGCDNGGGAGKLLRFDPVGGTWTQLASAIGTHAGGTVMDIRGKIYWDNGTVGTGVEVYDPATNTWSQAAAHRVPRIGHASGSVNGVGYSAGGYTIGILNTTEYLDVIGNTWGTRSNMVAPVGSASSAVLNGAWYVVGGNGPGAVNTVATVQKYTPGDYWLTGNPMPTARGYHAAVSLDNDVYMIGGRLPGNTAALAVNEKWNGATGTWSTMAPLPSARWGAAAVGGAGRIYVIGGFTGDTGSTATNTVFEYIAATNTWTAKANAPTPIGFASAAVIGTSVFVSVGTDGTTFDGQMLYQYNPVQDAWTVLPNSPGVHRQGVAVGVAPFFALFGGGGASGAARNLDGYNRTTGTWSSGPQTPSALIGQSGAAINSQIYLLFGSNNGVFTATTTLFDGVTQLYSTKTSAPEALAFAATTASHGVLLTAGGFKTNGTATTALRAYIP